MSDESTRQGISSSKGEDKSGELSQSTGKIYVDTGQKNFSMQCISTV